MKDIYIKYFYTLFVMFLLGLLILYYPVQLEDSDADIHLAIIESFVSEPKFDLYNGFLFHWLFGFLSIITNTEEVAVSKTLLSLVAIAFMYKSILRKGWNLYLMFMSVLPLIFIFAFTLLRDDLIYLILLFMIFISSGDLKNKSYLELGAVLVLVGFRYSAIPFLLMIFIFHLIANVGGRKNFYKLIIKILIVLFGIAILYLLHLILVRFEASLNIILIFKYFIGPLQFVDNTIWTQYEPLIYAYYFFKVMAFIIFLNIIKEFGILPIIFSVLLTIIAMSPYIFIESLNGPRQQVFGYLVIFYFLFKIIKLKKNSFKVYRSSSQNSSIRINAIRVA